jgi:thiamine transport system substrate-binding protein
MKKSLLLTLLILAMIASACAQTVTPTSIPTGAPLVSVLPTPPSSPLALPESPLPIPSAARTLTVLTHEAFALSDDVLKKFETDNHVTVNFIKEADAGPALNRAILTKDNPEADVIFGIDNTLMGRALDAGILDPYKPAALAALSIEFQLDPSGQLTPIDYGDVCLNYDKNYFAQKKLSPPQALIDLTQPKYKNLLVVENPAGSSTGLAFMLATVSAFGENGWLNFWQQLKANGVKVDEDWNTAYYTDFSGSSGKGPRPIVVSYASSPPAEVVFANPPIDQPPVGAITSPQTCFRQIEFAGILKGTKNRDLAEKWIDFMLGLDYQQDIPLQQFVYPVNPQAKLPDVFVKWSVIAAQPANLAPDIIAKNRDRWVQAWTDVVLK